MIIFYDTCSFMESILFVNSKCNVQSVKSRHQYVKFSFNGKKCQYCNYRAKGELLVVKKTCLYSLDEMSLGAA